METGAARCRCGPFGCKRGRGKRSSFYSDFTFGLWGGEELLPIGKAYFGFTDVELRELDKWVRHHTIKSFGPVREVSRELVVEIAFDAVRIRTPQIGLCIALPSYQQNPVGQASQGG